MANKETNPPTGAKNEQEYENSGNSVIFIISLDTKLDLDYYWSVT